MIDWRPIDTAFAFLHDLDHLIERRGDISTYGSVWVWSEKDGLCEANYVDWSQDPKNAKQSHWRTVRLGYDGEAETLKPTHWCIINYPLDKPA